MVEGFEHLAYIVHFLPLDCVKVRLSSTKHIFAHVPYYLDGITDIRLTESGAHHRSAFQQSGGELPISRFALGGQRHQLRASMPGIVDESDESRARELVCETLHPLP